MSYRLKFLIFGVGILVFLFIADTTYETFRTLRRLDLVEAERDRWQRPADIIAGLHLRPGDTVVDLGCGSGYFTLKLADTVGAEGTVYAVDIRRLPLVFVWMRGVGKSADIKTVLGQPANPNVSSRAVNGVLILNTYHEFANRPVILKKVSQMLVPDGRLVIVDPVWTEHGSLSAETVEAELREHGFDIVSREDRFIEQPQSQVWWQLVAKRSE